jgi:hypothetical protein
MNVVCVSLTYIYFCREQAKRRALRKKATRVDPVAYNNHVLRTMVGDNDMDFSPLIDD